MSQQTVKNFLGLAALVFLVVACSETSNPVAPELSQTRGLALVASPETIDFESESEGAQNPSVFGDGGSGPIATSAIAAPSGDGSFECTTDTALIYDTTSGNGNDPDLDNQSGQGNVLVIWQNPGNGAPDDCFWGGTLTLDFSALGTVTMNSVVVLDIEEAGNKIELLAPGGAELAEFAIPITTTGDLSPPNAPGDGGRTTVNLGATAGVEKMVVTFVGTGAIDDVVFTPPMRGRNGCTPGFYKNNFGAWAGSGFSPGDNYNTVFGVGPSITLGVAVDANGGGLNALLRHSVAALISAGHGFSPLTVAEVISMVQNAINSGGSAIETTKNSLETYNALGCPLDADESQNGSSGQTQGQKKNGNNGRNSR